MKSSAIMTLVIASLFLFGGADALAASSDKSNKSDKSSKSSKSSKSDDDEVVVVPPEVVSIPAILTNTISQGSGTLDLLADVTAETLQSYITDSGSIFLGVDLNEAANGLESSTSAGIAIESAVLEIVTSDGSFSFSDLLTNTSADILNSAGTDAYNTLFGTAGGSEIAGNSTDFSDLDDVLKIQDVSFTGDIISATVRLEFVDPTGSGANEDFFDFSGGSEQFALVTEAQATAIDLKSYTAPEGVSFSASSPPGSPEPWWALVLLIPAIQLYKSRAAKK